MANTTFSGPIRAGNIRNTVGTTVGTDVANVGYVVMCQDTVQSLASGALAAVATDIVIPANSKIVDIIVDLEWGNIGTSDLRLNVTASAATNAGSVRITVLYAQAYNTVVQP